MKTRIIEGICVLTFFCAIFPDTIPLADANPIMSAMSKQLSHATSLPSVLSMMSDRTLVSPQASRYPMISAQQACLRGSGWNWRRGQFPICFKIGHDSCPTGHPWMRQRTQRYTICLSVNTPGQSPPTMGPH